MKKIITIAFILLAVIVNAQEIEKISLEQALELAKNNNKEITIAKLQEHYREMMSGTTFQLPKTQLQTDFGQVNSQFTDTKIGLIQSFNSFSVYKREKQVLLDEWNTSKLQTQVQQVTIDRFVRLVYLQLEVLDAKEKLLQKMDSLFAKIKIVAALRHKEGESTLLEKTTLDNEYAQLQLQQQLLQSDRLSAQMQFSVLVNKAGKYAVMDTLSDVPFLFDTTKLTNHPYLQLFQQQIQTASDMTLAEKSKLSPDWFIGYTNQSFVGWQSDKQQVDQYYDWKKRFNSGQIGISVPIFNKAQKTKIRASQINEKIAEANLDIAHQKMSLQLNQSMNEYKKNILALQYFKNSGLIQSEQIISQANKQYSSGDINYLDWLVLMRNAVSIENQYIDQLNSLQNSAIELRYLLYSFN